ncbi:hypothetical protein EV651_103405 [Kribbella sp. VKM Ac-2571]|nr:hypothetical protein EV651_103405 [Kribbella sp. VKM Ac-2571]
MLGPAFDVLAANPIADALLSPFGDERNMPWILCTHPQAEVVFADWQLRQRSTVHALRLNAGRLPNDPAITDVVARLSKVSPRFRTLWDDNEVGSLARAFKVFIHPVVGRIELTYQTFEVLDAPRPAVAGRGPGAWNRRRRRHRASRLDRGAGLTGARSPGVVPPG